MELTKTGNPVDAGLKGWLILPMIAIIVQVIAFFNSLRGFSQAVNPFRLTLNIWIFSYNILLIALTLHVAYFFFKKKDITPIYFIIYRIVLFIPWVFIFLAGDKYPLTSAAQASLAQPFLAHTIGLLIFVPYFIFSKRVKATFIEPLDTTKTIERVMVKLQPRFDKFGGFLYKTRKFLILEVIGLIILTVFLGILIMAL